MPSRLSSAYSSRPSPVNQSPSDKHRPRLRGLAEIELSSPASYRVWMYRSGRANRHHQSTARQCRVARDLGISERSVIRAEKELARHGILKVSYEARPEGALRVCTMAVDLGDDRTWPMPTRIIDEPRPVRLVTASASTEGDTDVTRVTPTVTEGDTDVTPRVTRMSHHGGTLSEEPLGGGEEPEKNPPPAAPLVQDTAAPDPDATRLQESWLKSRETLGGIGRPDPEAARKILAQLPAEPERRRMALEKVERVMAFLPRDGFLSRSVTTLAALAEKLEAVTSEACAKDPTVRTGVATATAASDNQTNATRQDLADQARAAVQKRTGDTRAALAAADAVLCARTMDAARKVAEAAVRG